MFSCEDGLGVMARVEMGNGRKEVSEEDNNGGWQQHDRKTIKTMRVIRQEYLLA